MVTLHDFGPAFGLSNTSPFVMKVMGLLRLADIPFTLVLSDPRKGPNGRIPWIVDSGRTITDLTFIEWHLEEA
jgi:glutathione S-transferase